VLVPAASGVLSALGLAVADLRRDYVGRSFEELAAQVDLPGATLTRLLDMRYPGQSYELTIEEGADFGDAHERRFGFRLDAQPEIVTRRIVATVSRPRPSLQCQALLRPGPAARRSVFLDGAWVDVPVHGTGVPVAGPAIVELPEATCLVRPGWAGEPDAAGTLVLESSWTR
jgi:N-methylhydantoinase A